MATSTKSLLEPYLASNVVRPNGDMDMHCPLHEDARRSATVNFVTGEWYCHACEEGGTLDKLRRKRARWLPPPGQPGGNHNVPSNFRPLPDEARISGWNSALLSNSDLLEYMEYRRGIDTGTIKKFSLGWDGQRYTIPVYDETGQLVNIRSYSNILDPKIINWRGHGSPPRLYPIEVMLDDPDEIIFCEGEFDALVANQNGLPAITGTGGVKATARWRANWTDWFSNKAVYLCFDRDQDGLKAERKVTQALSDVVSDLFVIRLPYPLGSHKDLTDYFLDEGEPEALKTAVKKPKRTTKQTVTKLHEYESLRSGTMAGKPVEIEGTLAAVFGTQILLPKRLTGRCTQDWGNQCKSCPLGQVGGNLTKEIETTSEQQLELLGASTNHQRDQMFKQMLGAPSRCPLIEVDPEYFTAWDCEIRNGSNLAEEAYPIILRHEGKPPVLNNVYRFQGKLRVAPKGQRAIFMAAGCKPAVQDLDSFSPQHEHVEKVHKWVASLSGEPDRQLETISEKLEYHCTNIYGQRMLHMAMDLVYHSVLAFPFSGSLVTRGWMECLAIGETRSGKSTAAQRLLQLYGRGYYQSAENTTIPGMLYGLDRRTGSSRDAWGGTLGVLPLNHRGLVTIDEAQGLSKNQISQLSDMRSRGVVQISKVRSIEVAAQVRLIWLGNGRASLYARGIDALKDQMGQNEDLARVDIPVYILGDIGTELKKAQKEWGPLPWPRKLLQWIVLWAWSRKPDDIQWTKQATDACWEESRRLSGKFTTSIPIFQPNEAGVRLARMAVALAARLFSSPDGHKLEIKTTHVRAAARLYERFLGASELGVREVHEHEEVIERAQEVHGVELRSWLKTIPHQIIDQLCNGYIEPIDLHRVDQGGGYLSRLSGAHAIFLKDGKYIAPKWLIDMAKEVRYRQ